MQEADKQRVRTFLKKWQGSEGNERANYQTFFGDLCLALGVEVPPPKGSVSGDPYCFEKDIKFYSERTESTRFADFYKEGHFLIEAKQGSIKSSKGHGKRGTKSYGDAMQKAFNQGKSYAYNRMLPSLPPFLITCDIGSHFEIWQGFSGEYGSYGARQQVNLADLQQPEIFNRFVKIFTDPQSLNPEKYRARVTREVAADLAKLSRWLEAQGKDPQETASFLMRCIFTMFAEDVELLQGEMFTKALRDRWIPNPQTFKPEIESLWQTMNTGGTFGFERVLRFNGSFFEEAKAFELPTEQLEVLYAAAAKDWSQVEPAIFGTLLERALNKKERSRLGAHYTPRSYVERLVRPVVMEPLRQEWDEIELEIKRLLETEKASQQKKAEEEIRSFLIKLRSIKILDPACGTGNFLYVSLDLLKGLEQEVSKRLVDVVGEVQLNVLEQINPSQFLGIEINPRAAAIAELVIWIGYLQWYFKRYGNSAPPQPVLQAFNNIECRDAVLAYDGKVPDVDPKTGKVRTRWGGKMIKHPVTEEDIPDPDDQVVIYKYLNARQAEWPEADYVVSNPPFIGNKKMKSALGEGYVWALRGKWEQVSESADFVMYWWNQAAFLVKKKSLQGFGLITTNSLSQTFNKRVLESHVETSGFISFALPDHPWVDSVDGAQVRVAMTGFSQKSKFLEKGYLAEIILEKDESHIDFKITIGKINPDLSVGVNLSNLQSLLSNLNLSCPGVQLSGQGFVLSEQDLSLFSSETKSKIIRKYLIGRSLTQIPKNKFVIDTFGLSESDLELQFPDAYQWLLERVKPSREQNTRRSYAEKWWLHAERRSNFRKAFRGIKQFIVTSRTSRHRTFQIIPVDTLPETSIVIIALEDKSYLGILSSRIHVVFANANGGWLGVGHDSTYNHSKCFVSFPFPDPTPQQKQKIRQLGERLDSHRKQVQANHPEITITGMYNLLEKLRAGETFTKKDREYNNKALVSTLKQIHDELDTAVFEAYGWPQNLTDEEILQRLVNLNAERAEEERNGLIRWLRPEYQAPEEIQHQQTTLTEITTPEETIVPPVEQQKWPSKPKEQLAAIRDLLRSTPGQWTVKQIAAQFKGRITPKKLDAIAQNLERLEWFGLVISNQEQGITRWQFTELQKAS
ncbi:MAG: DNA methyltransferase [Spirulinaceae cyanobacterium]